MTIQEICQLLSVVVPLLVSLIGFITALCKVIKEKQWNILKSRLCQFMIEAEKVVGLTGEEKKDMVLTWCEDFCREQGIKFDSKLVSSAIETLIDLTKKVNTGAATDNT